MSSRALLIAEGAGREDVFFTKIREAYGFQMEIVPFCGNVSMLYDEMAKSGFMLDVKSLLREKTTDAERLKILEGDYSDIFLVFDLDPQHNICQLEGESVDDAIRRNTEAVVAKARSMALMLTNSTEPTRGQLYINYPGIESFRDADDFFDASFAKKKVRLADLCKLFGGAGYKSISTRGKLSQKKVAKFSAGDFSLLARMQVYKLRSIVEGTWGSYLYEDFRRQSDQSEILRHQIQEISAESSLWVLNTSLFLLIDYMGKNFYNASIC